MMSQNSAIDEGLRNGEGSSASAMKDRAAKTIEKGVEAAQDTFEQAAFQTELAAEQASEELQKLAASGSKFVRENPGTAIAGAVGVGILVGLALRGRD